MEKKKESIYNFVNPSVETKKFRMIYGFTEIRNKSDKNNIFHISSEFTHRCDYESFDVLTGFKNEKLVLSFSPFRGIPSDASSRIKDEFILNNSSYNISSFLLFSEYKRLIELCPECDNIYKKILRDMILHEEHDFDNRIIFWSNILYK